MGEDESVIFQVHRCREKVCGGGELTILGASPNVPVLWLGDDRRIHGGERYALCASDAGSEQGTGEAVGNDSRGEGASGDDIPETAGFC